MGAELGAVSGLATIFLLGLRHGFDPDHIACIDGFTWRSLDRHQRFAPWVGTLFALGHGFTVTAIAAGIGEVSRTVPVSDELMTAFSWIPTFLLFLVGILNLRQLLQVNQGYRPDGWSSRLVPKTLRDQSNPFAIVFVGMLFAAVFDTATQASMWAYVGTTNGGTTAALIAGLAFTFGMMVTDTIDGRLLCRIVKRPDGARLSQRYQRASGWLIVGLSFGAGFYNVAKALLPAVELSDAAASIFGFSLLFVVFLIWLWSYRGKLLRV
jgi:high-affinity nickel-transport protein